MIEKASENKNKLNALYKRLSSTILLWLVVAIVFYSRQSEAILSLTLLISALGGYEFIKITRNEPGTSRRWVSFAISLIYLSSFAWHCYKLPSNLASHEMRSEILFQFQHEFIALLLVFFVNFTMSMCKEIQGRDTLYAVGLNLIGFCFIPLLFGGFMIRLFFLPPSVPLSGAWLLIFVAVVTKFTDMGAYIAGSLLGRHKMIKHISPGKTWEGAIGSFFFALLGAFGIWYLSQEGLAWITEWWHIAILSVLISIAAIKGDLAESILKRSLKVKDSGEAFPGIGGILDLIDSICFAAPITFFYISIFVL